MKSFVVLGDVHLGRKFRTGVPLHRVGEREKLQWKDFNASLQLKTKVDLHICMGDLFDKFVVPPEVMLGAAEAYISAAQRHTDTCFVVIQGNHDVSRDRERMSSFEIFSRLVSQESNIKIIREAQVFFGYGFLPYDPFISAEEMVSGLPDNLPLVFSHLDFVDFGGDHVLPTELLAEKGLKKIINGHDHIPREEKRHGVTVTMTGSMQPYSHAEDPTGQWYVSLPLEQIDPDAVRDKNVRVLLRQGETLPAELDCLSLTSRWMDAPDKIEIDTSDFETLDINQLLRHALDGLPILDEVMAKFEEIRE